MTAIETIATSAVVSLIVSFTAFEYRHRREQTYETKQEVNEWYAEAAELARQVQHKWRLKYTLPSENGSFTGYDEVKGEMELFATQLSAHASKSQNLDVDPAVVEDLEEAAECCVKLSEIWIGMSGAGIDEFNETGEELLEKTENLQEKALGKLS